MQRSVCSDWNAASASHAVVLINTNLIVGKISLVWKIEVGKHARSGNLRVGKVVESGKVSLENNSLDSCSREKDVAPKTQQATSGTSAATY